MAKTLYDKLRANPPSLSNGQRLEQALQHSTTLTADQTPIVQEEYLRFLAMRAAAPQGAVPSRLVDLVWQQHSADQAAYQDYGALFAPHPLPQRPSLAPAGDDLTYRRMLECYNVTWGHAPDPRVWPTPETLQLIRRRNWAIGFCFLALALGGLAAALWGGLAGVTGGLMLALAGAIALVYALSIRVTAPWAAQDKSGDGGGAYLYAPNAGKGGGDSGGADGGDGGGGGGGGD